MTETLIFDRTADEVAAVADLLNKRRTGETLTDAELRTLSRGTYNAIDVNRVSAAVNEISDALREMGYIPPSALKADWTTADSFTRSYIVTYLAAVAAVRAAFPASESTPEAPDITRWIDYEAANDIERLLWEVSHTIEGAKAIMRVSGSFTAGDDYIMQIIRRG